MLGRRQVLPTVPSQLTQVMVEGTFPDGTFLVTVLDPISSKDGNIELALYSSFLPIPNLSIFGSEKDVPAALPGKVNVSKKREAHGSNAIVMNQGRERTKLKVVNMGDRPVQVSPGLFFWPVPSLLSPPVTHFSKLRRFLSS